MNCEDHDQLLLFIVNPERDLQGDHSEWQKPHIDSLQTVPASGGLRLEIPVSGSTKVFSGL